APRGVPQIEVTFDIDANGILSVSAKDKATGKAQNIRIEASSGLSKEEIERMKNEAEANADADKKAKEEIEKLNLADAMIFQTEKQLKEYGDKLPADKKGTIETALTDLKAAHSAKDVAKVDTAMTAINAAWQAASQEMHAAMNDQQKKEGGDGQQNNTDANANNQNNGDNVQDVNYEEVK
ncbi:MAG TPA: Hsp70 family protein, partial [Bacteroidia bacterium]|nr:Hsp70 family protein [Bacteroidia bacterium]